MSRLARYALTCFLGGIFMSSVAQARVFNFKNEGFGAFLRGNYMFSNAGNGAFDQSSGDGSSFSDELQFASSGEFGFILSFDESFSLRLGLEVMQAKVSDVAGNSTAGVKMFSVTSKSLTYTPMLSLEFHTSPSPTFRWTYFLGGGWTQVNVENTYDMTTSGTSEFSLNDHVEDLKGSALAFMSGLGFEFHLANTTTVQLETGYRHMFISELKHTDDVNTFTRNAKKGEKAITHSGKTRELDLGGPYVGLTLRFYIEIL